MEAKPCPVCKKLSIRFHRGYEKKEKVSCCNPACPIRDIKMDFDIWQTREQDDELQKTIDHLKFLLNENKKVYCSKDGDFPGGKRYNDTGCMIMFQIEGETYIGGYIEGSEEWFSVGEDTFKNENYTVYWKYLDDLKFYYEEQRRKK